MDTCIQLDMWLDDCKGCQGYLVVVSSGTRVNWYILIQILNIIIVKICLSDWYDNIDRWYNSLQTFFSLITKSIIKCTQLFFRIIKAVKSKKKRVLPPKYLLKLAELIIRRGQHNTSYPQSPPTRKDSIFYT
jgi:hypothetical protein